MKILIWLTATLGLTACLSDRETYSGMDFEVISSPPSPVSIESDRIELSAGIAVEVLAFPVFDYETERWRDVTLRPGDDEIFDVYHGEGDGEFVLVGLSPGRSCLRVRIGRREQECIDVRVSAPPEG